MSAFGEERAEEAVVYWLVGWRARESNVIIIIFEPAVIKS
jgi:hypothetical protein